MNKRAFLSVFLAVFLVMAFSLPVMAADNWTPNRNHSGNIGTSKRIVQYGYFDNLVGDGTNANLYGYKMGIKTVTASATLDVADIGKMILVGDTNQRIKITLPTVPAGGYYWIMNNSSSNVDIQPTAQYILALTNSTADPIRNATKGNSIIIGSPNGGLSLFGVPYGTWSDAL